MKHLRLHSLLNDISPEEVLPFKRHLFNGGEDHIQIQGQAEHVLIETGLRNSAYVMELMLAVDALRRNGTKRIELFAPYIPYARQDRVMNEGEALSIKVFTEMLNSLNLETVYTLDNHSPVATALINNCVELDRNRILWDILHSSAQVLVSPDAGAEKKTLNAAKYFNLNMITCSKVRDVTNGEIKRTDVHSEDLGHQDCIILDDICDGGRTFVEIAKVLKSKNAGMISLYVSHGIFAYALHTFEGLIDRVYTANCFRPVSEIKNDKVKFKVLPIRKEDLK